MESEFPKKTLMAEAEAIRFNTTAVGTDQLDDLAKVIGRIAVEAFRNPEVRKQYEAWKKEKETGK